MKEIITWDQIKDAMQTGSHKVEMTDALCHILEKERMKDYDLYRGSMLCLYKALHGEHFNEQLATEAVAGMMNEDGTKGAKWDMMQVKNFMNQYRPSSALYNEYDFYYVMNMLWSDHSRILGSDANLYAKMAISWLEDKDVPEGKAFRYYFNVAKAE